MIGRRLSFSNSSAVLLNGFQSFPYQQFTHHSNKYINPNYPTSKSRNTNAFPYKVISHGHSFKKKDLPEHSPFHFKHPYKIDPNFKQALLDKITLQIHDFHSSKTKGISEDSDFHENNLSSCNDPYPVRIVLKFHSLKDTHSCITQIKDKEQWKEHVLNSSWPVFVCIISKDCKPCQQLLHRFENQINLAQGKIKLAYINLNDSAKLRKMFLIQNVPSVYLYKNGQILQSNSKSNPNSKFLERSHKLCHELMKKLDNSKDEKFFLKLFTSILHSTFRKQ